MTRLFSPHHDLPQDLAPLAVDLDRLAAAEQAAARSGIEERIASAARPGVPQPLHLAHGSSAQREIVVVRRINWAVRIAAAIAIVVGGYGAYLALQTGVQNQAGPTVASEDGSIGNVMAQGLAILDAASPYSDVEALLAEAERLNASIQTDFIDPAAILGTGSM